MAKNLKELIDVYQSIYYIENPSVIPLLCSVMLSARMPGDPIWLALVGGSSSGKTELINALAGVKWASPVSIITPNTFLSGMKAGKGEEMSLLLQLPPEFVLLFKDFTSILSMNKDDLKEVMGQLREIFDGEMIKKTGNSSKPLKWKGKGCVIAGTTEDIHVKEALFASAGVRFIYYTLPLQDRIKTAKRAAGIAAKLPELREMIRKEFTEYLEHMLPIVMNGNWEVTEDVSDRIIHVADFTTRARSPVVRDYKGRMEMVLSQEMPMRFSNQLHNLARAEIAQHEGILIPQSEANVYQIAFDSIPKGRKVILMTLAQYDIVSTKGLAMQLRFETERTHMWLEELNFLGLVDRKGGGGSKGDRWELVNDVRETIETYNAVQKKGSLLEDPEFLAAEQSTQEAWDNI